MASPDRVILITGCSSGIGRATAEALLERGHIVFATVRRVESVDDLREALSRFDDRAFVRRLDVTEAATSETVVAEVIERFGHIDALVNNAAYGQISAVEELSPEELRKQYEVNVVGLHDLTLRVLRPMREVGTGRIINVTSVVAHVSTPFNAAYNSSKAAVNALSESLRLELTGTDIHVVLIEPGMIRSEFRANAMRHWDAERAVRDSRYGEAYATWLRRWDRRTADVTPPSAVAKRIVHAVEAKRPKTRYRITPAACIAPYIVALLPDRWSDRIVLRGFNLGRSKS